MRFMTLRTALCAVRTSYRSDFNMPGCLEIYGFDFLVMTKPLRQPPRTNGQPRRGHQISKANSSTNLQWRMRADAMLKNIWRGS